MAAISSPALRAAAALAVTLLFLSHPAEAGRQLGVKILGEAAGESVESLCSRTDYPPLCITAARGVRPSPASITQATIQAAIQRAKEAAGRLRSAGSRGTTAVGRLETCRETYDSAVADLQTSLRALKSGSLPDLKINLSAVISDVGACDDAFAEGGKASPLAGTGGGISKFASNALALCNMMKHDHS